VRVTVVRPSDLGPSEASLWARFQKSSAELQNPFFSLTFAQVVDRHRPNARVAVVEDDGAIQASLVRIRPDLSSGTDAYYLEKVARRDAG
jgi:CelD/BcsL family acetyltransferase involved in cellulose biosynthesis